jgi:hypothetical protein
MGSCPRPILHRAGAAWQARLGRASTGRRGLSGPWGVIGCESSQPITLGAGIRCAAGVRVGARGRASADLRAAASVGSRDGSPRRRSAGPRSARRLLRGVPPRAAGESGRAEREGAVGVTARAALPAVAGLRGHAPLLRFGQRRALVEAEAPAGRCVRPERGAERTHAAATRSREVAPVGDERDAGCRWRTAKPGSGSTAAIGAAGIARMAVRSQTRPERPYSTKSGASTASIQLGSKRCSVRQRLSSRRASSPTSGSIAAHASRRLRATREASGSRPTCAPARVRRRGAP